MGGLKNKKDDYREIIRTPTRIRYSGTESLSGCNYVCLYLCLYASLSVSLSVCIFVCLYLYLYVCMFVCLLRSSCLLVSLYLHLCLSFFDSFRLVCSLCFLLKLSLYRPASALAYMYMCVSTLARVYNKLRFYL